MGEPGRTTPTFWMPELDGKGRQIAQELAAAARRVWPRAYSQVVRDLNDDSRASEIFESAVFAVSNVLHRNGHEGEIRDLDAYLYWAFARKLNKRVLRDRMIQFVDALELMELKRRIADQKWLSDSDQDLLLGQVIRYMDGRTKRIFLLRAGGRTWERIAQELGTNANNAAVLFNYGMTQAKGRILKRTAQKARVPNGKRG